MQPANVTTPEDAASGFDVQLSTAPEVPVPAVIESVTDSADVVTTSPEASSTSTTGCVASGDPCAEPAGCTPKTSLEAVPATVKLAVVPEVSPALAADSVERALGAEGHLAACERGDARDGGDRVRRARERARAGGDRERDRRDARGHHVARGVLDLRDRLGAERRAPVELEGWAVKTSWDARPRR